MKKMMKSAMILLVLALALTTLTGCGKKDEIPAGAQVCAKCGGTKVCQVCGGDGVLELNDMLGGRRTCSFCLRGAPGACRTCKSLGYVMSRR